MNQRKASSRYYLFEEMVWDTPAFAPLKVPVPLVDLQLLAGLVWAREKGRGPCPTISRNGRKKWSFYVTSGARGQAGKISLSAEHQNLGGLLHELAHALGHNDKLTHGPAFRRRCTHLYKVYGGWSGEIDWDIPANKRKRVS